MSKAFHVALQERRSVYGISKEKVTSDERIQEIIEMAVKHTPSSFNSQSARVLVLLGEHQDKLWDITKGALKKIVPADNFSATEEKINSFQKGYGTVLFFEDQSVIEQLQSKFALYKDNFPVWSQQSSGMLQFVIWTSLEAEGFGASLQHYSPLIDTEVSQQWNVPSAWKLIAQLPFGKPTVMPSAKEFSPLADRVKFLK